MTFGRASLRGVALTLVLVAPVSARADEALGRYFDAMTRTRLLAIETGNADQLRALVAQGEQLRLDGRDAEALVPLYEVAESPRFADFRELPEAIAAEHALASSLAKLGAFTTARRYLERVIARGPHSAHFGLGVRAYVDVALELGDADASADWLEPKLQGRADEASELAFLRGHARYAASDLPGASRFFARVGIRSRFYGSAQYLSGVIAARLRRYREAEQRFCGVAKAGTGSRYAFYVDDRFFSVQDLARLGLGRVAHETRRGDDAFYYYFQVPHDSPRLAEALFEAAYATYEAEEPDTAIDLLDQLEARFPHAPLADEAAILRGYVALARCDFDKADAQFGRFVTHFARVLDETRRLLADSSRRRSLHAELLEAREGSADPQGLRATRRELLALIEVDPELYRVHRELEQLDAEAARASRVPAELEALRTRLLGEDRPRAATPNDASEPAAPPLREELDAAYGHARALGRELDSLRAAGVAEKQLAPLERELTKLGKRIDAIEGRLQRHRVDASRVRGGDAELAPDAALPDLLARDVLRAQQWPERVEQVRAELLTRADVLAQASLRALEQRLSGWLSRARIGRIDAVMGSKRRTERQIESLAAGRIPPELNDPMRARGLLADDEEYWPFEGEDWPDEHEEHYSEQGP